MPTAVSIHKLLDAAAKEFHAMRGNKEADRGTQFDAHMATVNMVVDHTAAGLANDAAEKGSA